MKLTLTRLNPRNPIALPARMRQAGAHRRSAGAHRQAQKRQLQSELRLARPSP